MERNVRTVAYGHVDETNASAGRGTLVYYDTFEDVTDGELEIAARLAKERSFAKLVLYPLHEETAKRMWRGAYTPYYKREDRLFDWRRERGLEGEIAVENWEGKRKKYTPVDAALRHLAEQYSSPLFLYVRPDTANAFASFASFDEWIVKLRLILTEEPTTVHPKLEKHRHRWDVAGSS